MEWISFALLGFIVGALANFLGIGGGSLLVPLISYLRPEWHLSKVIFLSLGIILINSINNTRIFILNKTPLNYALLAKISLGCILGASISSYLAPLIPSHYLKVFLALVLFLIGIKQLRSSYGGKTSSTDSPQQSPSIRIIDFLIGFCAGLLSPLTGLGGGILFIPLLISYYQFSPSLISPHSNALMIVTSLFGIIPMSFQLHGLPLQELGIILLGSFIGAQLFSSLEKKIKVSTQKKKRIFGTLIIFLALKIFYETKFI